MEALRTRGHLQLHRLPQLLHQRTRSCLNAALHQLSLAPLWSHQDLAFPVLCVYLTDQLLQRLLLPRPGGLHLHLHHLLPRVGRILLRRLRQLPLLLRLGGNTLLRHHQLLLSPRPPPLAQLPQAAAKPPEPPVSGNRVNENLIVVKDSGGHGHVVSKHNATFHLFTHDVLHRYSVNANNQFYIPPNACEEFRVMTASYSMPIEELIEQLDCIKIAPPNWPRYAIGIAEAFDLGNGWFQVGTKFHLDEPKSLLSIKEAWSSSIGEMNESRPKYLIRIPGKAPCS